MVTRSSIAFVVLALLGTGSAPGRRAAEAQVPPPPPLITVVARPPSVWVGDDLTLVATVVTRGSLPEEVSLDPPPGLELVDVTDRSTTRVGAGGAVEDVIERRFLLRAVAPGRYGLPPVRVVVGGIEHLSSAVEVEAVAAPLEWSRGGGERRRAPDRGDAVIPQGVPVPGTSGQGRPFPVPTPGADPDRLPPLPPGAPAPGPTGPGRGQLPPYDPHAPRGPGVSLLPEGWGDRARGDPWWVELVPELHAYQSEEEDPSGRIRLAAGVHPERVYVGQQVTFTGTVFLDPGASLRLATAPEYVAPSPRGFWSVELLEPEAGAFAASRGRVQEGFTFRRAFFPIEAGLLEIPPARVLHRVGTRIRPELGPETLATAPIPVEVLPVPASGAPPGFTGAVGRYMVEAAVTPSRVTVGESALLIVKVLGAGYVPALPPPPLPGVPGVRFIPAGDRAALEVMDGVVGGVKTFRWLAVPEVSGVLPLGPVVYAWFDPWLGAFSQAATGELLLEVVDFPPDPPQREP